MTVKSFDIRVPIIRKLPHVGRRLPNGCSIVFVEDKDNTKPAAAMSIAVGSNQDPPEFPGLAHFCEHMLFMGTEKYPSEDAYDEAVTRSGGYSNAWTASDVTTYYFTSGLDKFKDLVEMFLEFFVSPSFNPSAVDREINAVHSEDEKNHSDDYWRFDELFKSLFVKEHPNSRYGNGNLTTLKTEPEAKGLKVRDALKEFFDEYYVAERSCLVLYSPFSPDELTPLIEPILGKMKCEKPAASQSFLDRLTTTVLHTSSLVGEALSSSSSAPSVVTSSSFINPLQPSTFKKWFNIITNEKEQIVTMYWPLPYGLKHWRDMPFSYASHLLGHEAKGSVIAALREKGWATAMTAGSHDTDIIDNDFCMLTAAVTLTEEGFLRVPEVLHLIFQYIELIRGAAESIDIDVDACDFAVTPANTTSKPSTPQLCSAPATESETEEGDTAISDMKKKKLKKTVRAVPCDSYDEMRREMLTAFEFSDLNTSDEYASALSNKGAQVGAENCVAGHQIIFDSCEEQEQNHFVAAAARGEDNGDKSKKSNSTSLSLRIEAYEVLKYLSVENCFVSLSAGSADVFRKAHAQGAFVGNVDFNGASKKGEKKRFASPKRSKEDREKDEEQTAETQQTQSNPSTSASAGVTRFHKMPFTISEIPDVMVQAWGTTSHHGGTHDETSSQSQPLIIDASLALPRKNPFLSEDFRVHEPPAPRNTPPARIDMKFGYALAARNEPHLMVPKLFILVNIIVPTPISIATSYYRNILESMVTDATSDTAYFANLSGIHFQISNSIGGFIIEFSGPSATVGSFALDILKQIMNASFLKQSKEMFEAHVKKYQQKIEGYLEGQPSDLTDEVFRKIYSMGHFTAHETIAFADKVAYISGASNNQSQTVKEENVVALASSSYCDMVDELLKSFYVEVVVCGNLPDDGFATCKETILNPIDGLFSKCGVSPARADQIEPYRDFYVPKEILEESGSREILKKKKENKALKLMTKGEEQSHIFKTNEGRLFLYNLPPYSKKNVNSAVTVRLYAGPATPENYPEVSVLSNLMASSFYAALRTSETLGYIVASAESTVMEREAYFVFCVQSAVAGPFYLYSRIHAFINAFETQILEGITKDEIDGVVQGAIESRKQLETSVHDRGLRIFRMRLHPSGFDATEKEVATLEKKLITRDSLLKLYRERIANVVASGSQSTADEVQCNYDDRDNASKNDDTSSSASCKRRGVVVFINSNALTEQEYFDPDLIFSHNSGVESNSELLLFGDVKLPIKRDTSSIKAQRKSAAHDNDNNNKKTNKDEVSDHKESHDDEEELEETEEREENGDEEEEDEESEESVEEEDEDEEGEESSPDDATKATAASNTNCKLDLDTFEGTPTYAKFCLSSFEERADGRSHAERHRVPLI